jgi:hypothetical protein
VANFGGGLDKELKFDPNRSGGVAAGFSGGKIGGGFFCPKTPANKSCFWRQVF